jgi:hypothetical protein
MAAQANDALQTGQQLLDQYPDAVAQTRSRGPLNRGFTSQQALRNTVHSFHRDAVGLGLSHLLPNDPGDNTNGHPATPTTPSDAAVYRLNISALQMMLGSLYKRLAAQVDVIIVGAGNWAKSFDLAGAAPAVLADGNEYQAALVATFDENGSGDIELCLVFGAEAASSTAPTATEIVAALNLGLTTRDKATGIVLGRMTIGRSGATITTTVVDPATDDALAQERAAGFLFDLIGGPAV